MEQIRNYEIAQEFVDKVTGTVQEQRHAAQRELRDGSENRAQRRERERQERRAAKKAAKKAAKVKV